MLKTTVTAQLALVGALQLSPQVGGAVRAPTHTCRSALSEVRAAVDDKTEVREYFNTEGFNRWSRIYSEDGEVNSVQLDIRTGHAKTVEKVLGWVDADGTAASGATFCDAGCGVGSLAIPLAQRGAEVSASDISSSMADEAAARAKSMGIENAKFSTSDLESIEGNYNTVRWRRPCVAASRARGADSASGSDRRREI